MFCKESFTLVLDLRIIRDVVFVIDPRLEKLHFCGSLWLRYAIERHESIFHVDECIVIIFILELSFELVDESLTLLWVEVRILIVDRTEIWPLDHLKT